MTGSDPNKNLYVFIAHGDKYMKSGVSTGIVRTMYNNVSKSEGGYRGAIDFDYSNACVDLRASDTSEALGEAAPSGLQDARVLAITSPVISAHTFAAALRRENVAHFVMKVDLDDPADVASIHAAATKELNPSALTAVLPRLPIGKRIRQLATAAIKYAKG